MLLFDATLQLITTEYFFIKCYGAFTYLLEFIAHLGNLSGTKIHFDLH